MRRLFLLISAALLLATAHAQQGIKNLQISGSANRLNAGATFIVQGTMDFSDATILGLDLGSDGKVIIGSGAPSDLTGNNGDTYQRTDTGGIYYKSAGTWTLQLTFAVAGHTHTIANVTGLQAALDNKQPLATVLTNTTASFTTAQESKLAGIAAGATANATDAQLRDRATHTGAQAIATVTGLQTALDNKQPLATVLTNTTASFTMAQESKLAGIAAGATANATDAQLRDRATHTGAQAIATITGLQTALDNKQPLATGTPNGSKFLGDDGSWKTIPAGFTNPMTTTGDIIVGGSGGAAQRLGVGTNGKVLKIVGGVPSWEDDSTGAGSLPATPTTGDLVYYNGIGWVSLGLGSAGNVLKVNATADAMEWGAVSGTGTVTSVELSGGSTGLTATGGPVTTSGTFTLGGTLAVANGGTGQTTYTNGQLLIGNTTGGTLTKATLAGTNNQIIVTNGPGTITLSTPQNIDSTSNVSFASVNASGSRALMNSYSGTGDSEGPYFLNTNAGTGAGFSIFVGNESSLYRQRSLRMGIFGVNYTTTGLKRQDGAWVVSETDISGGLVVGTRGNAPLIFATNDTEVARFEEDGDFVVDEDQTIGGALSVTGPASAANLAGTNTGDQYLPFAVLTETTTARTLALTDARKWVRCTNAAAVAIEVPPQSSVAWSADTEIIVEQAGAGQVTITPGSGVTLNSSLTLKTLEQYSVIALKRVASDVWTVVGEREE